MKLTISNTDTNTDPDAANPIIQTATVAFYVDGGAVQFLASGESRTLETTKPISLVFKNPADVDEGTLMASLDYTDEYVGKSIFSKLK